MRAVLRRRRRILASLAVFCALATVVVLHRISALHPDDALTIEVTGQQWSWQVRYLDKDASRVLTTTNEIHIPIGKPVRVRLSSADVIHSFWVPALGGRTDAIPGRTNAIWIEAGQPGRYHGPCAEYCGVQHARMTFHVVAEPPEQFAQWYERQLQPVTVPSAAQIAEASHAFE